jgi:2-polyprenyl-3-methyl-5-hydroxy-6-metoxy-1,4-benzoquinol methylase
MDRGAYEAFLDLDRSHFWRRAKRRLVLQAIDAHLEGRGERGRARMLDVGAACSLLGPELAERGEVTLIEPDAPTAALAREELGLTVLEGALPDALPVDGPFHVITALDVLEHVEEDRRAVRALSERLAADGLLVVTVPALEWLWSEHDLALEHKRRYTSRGLRACLEAGGIEVLRLSYYTSLLLPLVAASRLLRRSRVKGSPRYRVAVPAAPINAACAAVMGVERKLMHAVDLPYGACLFAVGRRRA